MLSFLVIYEGQSRLRDSWELHAVLLSYISSNFSCLRSVFYTDSILTCRTWALQLMGWEDEGTLHISMAWLTLVQSVPYIILSLHFSELLKLGSSGKILYLSLLSFLLLEWRPIELTQGFTKPVLFFQLQKTLWNVNLSMSPPLPLFERRKQE